VDRSYALTRCMPNNDDDESYYMQFGQFCFMGKFCKRSAAVFAL